MQHISEVLREVLAQWDKKMQTQSENKTFNKDYCLTGQPQGQEDLTKLQIQYDHELSSQSDYSVVTEDMEAYFRNLEERLIEKILESHTVLGCVAWLTSENILEALAQREACLIVQKEDFLRPDLNPYASWPYRLRSMYEKLHFIWERPHLPGEARGLCMCSDPTVEPVRCCGNLNAEKKAAMPRAHHKFAIFCNKKTNQDAEERTYERERLDPYAVWTGSFNWTKNATRSFENAIFTRNKQIVEAFTKEWSQVFCLSEQIDWTWEWSAPQYRIGT